MRAVLVPSEVVVGRDRFAVGLMDSSGEMIHDAAIHFQYYDLGGAPAGAVPPVESEADATRVQTPDGLTTIYAHERTFSHAGRWGVAISGKRPDGTSETTRIAFDVVAQSPTLKIGQKVPSVDTPTAADVNGDYHRLTSSLQPNPAFYQVSLKQALQSGKPTVLLLATPSFCTSRLCGPAYDTTTAIENKYGDKLNYVSLEVYSGLPNPAATNYQLAPIMHALGLTTEPWLFLIDRDGSVTYRVEGLFTADELEPYLQALFK